MPLTRVHDHDRKQFHLALIHDTARELTGLRHPKTLLEFFLMSAQGGTGALGGFAALTDGMSNLSDLVVRGQDTLNHEDILCLIHPQAPDSFEALEATRILPQSSFPGLSDRFPLILACPLEEGRRAFVGLCPAMHSSSYDDADQDLLISLSSLFQISLNAALFSTRVELLNTELEKRNTDLDRQVFYLEGLRELSSEAADTQDTARFLISLLPTLLGRFSRSKGMVVLSDRSTGTVRQHSMGIEPEPVMSPETIDRILFLCLAGVPDKHIKPLQAAPVIDTHGLSGVIPGLNPHSAYLFLVKDQMYGAILLGSPLEERRFSDQDKELLSAFVTQSVLHLKNADSFEAIVNLNKNLERQNKALQKTIEDLTRAEYRINVLEIAAGRIAKMVTRNAERIMQVRPLDFALLILISLVLGTIYNVTNPKGIPFFPLRAPAGVRFISDLEAIRLVSEEHALLIDARPREFYDKGHAKEALNMPPALFDAIYPARFDSEDPERPIVIYGRNFSRRFDEDIARRLINHDHENIYIVAGDIKAVFSQEAGK